MQPYLVPTFSQIERTDLFVAPDPKRFCEMSVVGSTVFQVTFNLCCRLFGFFGSFFDVLATLSNYQKINYFKGINFWLSDGNEPSHSNISHWRD